MLVYTAFAQIPLETAFQNLPLLDFVTILFTTLILLLTTTILSWAGASRLLHNKKPEQVTALYCSSQKSLATGLPMLTLLLEPTPYPVALCSIPLLLYHPGQLALGSIIARKLRP